MFSFATQKLLCAAWHEYPSICTHHSENEKMQAVEFLLEILHILTFWISVISAFNEASKCLNVFFHTQSSFSWMPYLNMTCIFSYILSFGMGPGQINIYLNHVYYINSNPLEKSRIKKTHESKSNHNFHFSLNINTVQYLQMFLEVL